MLLTSRMRKRWRPMLFTSRRPAGWGQGSSRRGARSGPSSEPATGAGPPFSKHVEAPTVVQVGMLRDFQQRANGGQALQGTRTRASARSACCAVLSGTTPCTAARAAAGASSAAGSAGRRASAARRVGGARPHLRLLVIECHPKLAAAAPRLLGVHQALVNPAPARQQGAGPGPCGTVVVRRRERVRSGGGLTPWRRP